MSTKIFAKTIEEEAKKQIDTISNNPAFKNCNIRIMPDTHAGKGCVVGFTSTIEDKIVPNIVGSDIGCGMLIVELGKININYYRLEEYIRTNIPSGKTIRESSFFTDTSFFKKEFLDKLHCKNELKNIQYLEQSLGTLGGGNHFIEIDEDKSGYKYLIIHTGSRNLGAQVAKIYQEKAIKNCDYDVYNKKASKLISTLKAEGREKEIESALLKLKKEEPYIPKELSYLEKGTEDYDNYLNDQKICIDYADKNRRIIAEHILTFLELICCGLANFTTLHNYIDADGIIRKGAISAKKNELLLIPLNMRDGCILGKGKGNSDWNYSAPHGAGRLMSRSKAKQILSLDDYSKSMEGINTFSVCKETIDEAPMVYKSMDEIISMISETVEVDKILHPVYNFKAKDA